MLEIPGLMGENETYSHIADFVQKMHTYKSESIERLDKKVHEEKLRAEKSLTKMNKEIMEYIQIQERSVQ